MPILRNDPSGSPGESVHTLCSTSLKMKWSTGIHWNPLEPTRIAIQDNRSHYKPCDGTQMAKVRAQSQSDNLHRKAVKGSHQKTAKEKVLHKILEGKFITVKTN